MILAATFSAAVAATAPAQAVTAFTLLDIADPARSLRDNTGQVLRGTSDFQADTARASVNRDELTLRVFARDGGTTFTAAAGAIARLRERMTVTTASGLPEFFRFQYLVDAGFDTLSIETGGPVGGSATAFLDATLRLDHVVTRRNQTLRIGGFADLSHISRHTFVQGENPSRIARVIPFGPSNTPDTFIAPDRFLGGAPVINPVQDATVNIMTQSLSSVSALMEITALLAPGDVIELDYFLHAQAAGAVGHGARADGENTGRLGFILPDGATLTAESGLVIAQSLPAAPVAPIPLPPSALMLAAGLGLLALRRPRAA